MTRCFIFVVCFEFTEHLKIWNHVRSVRIYEKNWFTENLNSWIELDQFKKIKHINTWNRSLIKSQTDNEIRRIRFSAWRQSSRFLFLFSIFIYKSIYIAMQLHFLSFYASNLSRSNFSLLLIVTFQFHLLMHLATNERCDILNMHIVSLLAVMHERCKLWFYFRVKTARESWDAITKLFPSEIAFCAHKKQEKLTTICCC